MSVAHVVFVPSTIALLPDYAGFQDPISELRRCTHAAVAWLVELHPDRVSVVASDARPDNVVRGAVESPGERIARHLLSEAGFTGTVGDGAAGVLVVGNGTATRSEKAPGHLDERSFAYDGVIEQALQHGDPQGLSELDVALGEELWTYDAPAFRDLARLTDSRFDAEVDYADDPFGVQYWVVRWTCASSSTG